MPTAGQIALAQGFAALKSIHGSSWTFGAAKFGGVLSPLAVEDREFAAAPERTMQLLVLTSDMPAVRPEEGQHVTNGGRLYRVLRIADQQNGLTNLWLVVD